MCPSKCNGQSLHLLHL